MNVAETTDCLNALPLGANCDEDGARFSVFSEHAEKVELCLFDRHDGTEAQRIGLSREPDGTWSEHLTGLGAGQLYGYRVHGPWAPEQGHRFNPAKLLLDPYARQVSGELVLRPEHFGHQGREGDAALLRDDRDSAPFTPRCVVTEPGPPPRPLREPARQRIIYEAHVRGFTIAHEGISEADRGTFAGMSDARIIEYLRALGITSVELMPVQYFADEPALQQRGLRNYWGYNTLGFFAPATRYQASPQAGEFQHLVDCLHDAGLEVILDVVYNHSGEGDHFGPTLSFRGIDNATYYRLHPEQPAYYVNDTGCGNTLNVAHPRVRSMVLDSLRYWAGELGVDGFRFDLATTLAREKGRFEPNADLFREIQSDPLLRDRVLIAEPWDIGPDGYRLGEFPAGWSEWNDRYRDTVRRYWRGDPGMLPDLAHRLHGSADIYESKGKAPEASINFVTSHDGFTLADLVSYEQRYNQANGEDNRDGHHHNFSFNCGVEGDTDDPRIVALRQRQRRNLLATLLLSQGTPMVLSGDELGRSQGGNNNAYCQDNATNWFDWTALEEEREFLAFTRYLFKLRGEQQLLNWPEYIHDTEAAGEPQCRWYTSCGEPMNPGTWQNEHLGWLGKLLTAPGGEALLLLMNASSQNIPFRLPENGTGSWETLLDTAHRDFTGGRVVHAAGEHVLLRQRSLGLFNAVMKEE